MGRALLAGIDVGSTTSKLVALDGRTRELVFSRYVRHKAEQATCVAELLEALEKQFPHAALKAAVTGSGAKAVAEALGVPFIQEVVADSIAVGALYPQARTVIELGGQDAKIIFYDTDDATGKPVVSDMRMNGSCAGGTGAFIDEIAALLGLPVEEFDGYAARAQATYPISGRCGVFAKTDIQPLVNQGAAREDLARSTFDAIARQTIGGLAQGLPIKGPVVFAGGPLRFNGQLVRAFAEQLHLREEEVIVPSQGETLVALGAALAVEEFPFGASCDLDLPAALARLRQGATAEEGARPNATAPRSSAIFPSPGTTSAPDAPPAAASPLFASAAEMEAFKRRHASAPLASLTAASSEASVYVGIDAGSTTTKVVLLNEEGVPVDAVYAPNGGHPLDVACRGLITLRDRYRARGTSLNVLGAGVTGYGELMFQKAFSCDCHVVETTAHAHAALTFDPDASFVLDIGGQDMKALWVRDGVVTDVVMNEACSSGCGSFLEGFAATLGVPVEDIAELAATSEAPAALGSRCTVFMNSSIVSEQRAGKTHADILAGLCRSIVQNVFTKVIRTSNLDSLGPRVMVQGGTFMNDAVLKAFEDYLGREVRRAPYPGLMGAIGAALLARESCAGRPSAFIGLDALDGFTYEQKENVPCPFCENRCTRSVTVFPQGETFVTGNRCPRGEVVGDPSDAAVRERLRAGVQGANGAVNLFDLREQLLFATPKVEAIRPRRGFALGIPRVLGFWDNAPWWRTLFETLGFDVVFSDESSQALYESGIEGIASDTVCFPAKLVHGHGRNLCEKGVDAIFMPVITTVPPAGSEKTAESMCAIVKGYPLVMKASDDPERAFDVPLEKPLFHWYSTRDRNRQLADYLNERFAIPVRDARRAIARADRAQAAFRSALTTAGAAALEEARAAGRWAVVLASRPYQNDALVNHGLPRLFAERGISVLTVDSLPGLAEVDLSASRLDIANNFHARMLAGALIAARDDALEFAQIISFGCGHDAYLGDEIVRLMDEVSGAVPLQLKVDESMAAGALLIRVRSFIETVERNRRRRAARVAAPVPCGPHSLPDPYPVKYTDADREGGTVVLVPNTSEAFGRMMSAAFATQGLCTRSLPLGDKRAFELGKKYVHNDICFPAQVLIGEALAALESGEFDGRNVAVGMGKYVGDCRLTHYSALLRKALDDAGYAHVSIITNDLDDAHNVHPGFKMNTHTAMLIAWCLPMIDVLEELLRKMRPYELRPGAAEGAFKAALGVLLRGMPHGLRGLNDGFRTALEVMGQVPYDRAHLRPSVLIVGEYLLNFHPGANRNIEEYLEAHGFEVVQARMTDVIRKTYFYKHCQVKEYHVDKPAAFKVENTFNDYFFEVAHANCDRLARSHPLYERPPRIQEITEASDDIVHHTFDAGEGILIPAEILHHAAKGCRSFVILQPFGCLPNHVVGRGIVQELRRRYPDACILSLDYDPDMSQANLENRLQMLVMRSQGGRKPTG